MKRINLKFKKGFTLIELMTSIAVFTVVILAIANVFLMALAGSRKISSQQNVLDSGRFIMEVMTKEIRMSSVLMSAGGPFSGLSIRNSKGETVSFIFDTANRSILRGSDPLNPDEVEILTANFYIQKSIGLPARVTLVFSFRSKTAKTTEQAVINLQNTVSSRQYFEEAVK